MSNTTKYTLDSNAPLTPEQQKELARLGQLEDADINFDDIPELDEKFWQKAVRNPFYRPTKTATTMRLDSDVLAWFKQQGKGWQTRMNAVLRAEMLRALSS